MKIYSEQEQIANYGTLCNSILDDFYTNHYSLWCKCGAEWVDECVSDKLSDCLEIVARQKEGYNFKIEKGNKVVLAGEL